MVSQEPHAKSLQFVDAIGHRDGLEVLREPVRVTAWKPDIARLLPVYVADRYEGVEARTYLEISDAEIEDYLARNVAAVRAICEVQPPDIALANHLVMGPVVLGRALGDAVPYAVKIHGSALEYVVKRDPERFLPYAREGLAKARTVLVGSRHTAESLWEAMADPELPRRTRLGPPGVDVAEFRPMPDAAARVAALAEELEHEPPSAVESAFSRDAAAAADALRMLRPEDRHVVFVGKLIVSKGVDLLVAAWPLVLARVPAARLVIVGFGAYREGLERLLARAGGRGRRGGAGPGRGGPGGRGRGGCGSVSAAPPARVPGHDRRRLPRRRPQAARSGGDDRAARSMPSSRRCWPWLKPRSCRAPSPRRSAWSRRRRPHAARCRSRRITRGWRR